MLWPSSDYTRCSDCGTSIAADALERHRCDARHRSDHIERLAAADAEHFEEEFAAFMHTPQGRFERFYAERRRP